MRVLALCCWILATACTGPRGLPGAEGAPGTMGSQGVQGPEGSQGITGSDGAMGSQGSQGSQGPIGPQGPEGLAGSGAQTQCYVPQFFTNQIYDDFDPGGLSARTLVTLQASDNAGSVVRGIDANDHGLPLGAELTLCNQLG